MRPACAVLVMACVAAGLAGCKSAPPSESGADDVQHDEPKEVRAAVPDGIAADQTSEDPTYGYTMENPIKVGGPRGSSGPESERLYLFHLRDAKFHPITFERIGSFGPGPDGHVLDGYVITDHDGQTCTLYIDMYHEDVHPFTVEAPRGLWFWK